MTLKRKYLSESGLTLFEVMVALLIFAFLMVWLVPAQISNRANHINSQKLFLATIFAQTIMAQVETRFETQKFGETKETESGQGEGLFAPYSWTWSLDESPIEIPSLGLFEAAGKEIETSQAEKLLMLAQILNQNLKKVFRELSVTVSWIPFEGSAQKSYTLTTHLVDLTVEPSFMSIPTGGGGG